MLGVLTLALAFFGVKMLWSGSPRPAAASAESRLAPASAVAEPARSREMEEKMRESATLWQVLREKRGVDAAVAFTFDTQHYTLDPARRIVSNERERIEAPKGTVTTEEEKALYRLNQAKQDAKMIRLQAIMMSDEPTALINSQLKHTGDRVFGFTIKSIQERYVLVEKDGVTVPVEMAR